MYNAIQIGEVRRLYAKGLNDYEIASISGIPRYTVRRIRIREGLKPVKSKRAPHLAIYEVCHPGTGEVLFTGAAPDAAAFTGLNIKSFFTSVSRSNKGIYKRFIIRNVKREVKSLHEQ